MNDDLPAKTAEDSTAHQLAINLGTARRMCTKLYGWADKQVDGSVPEQDRDKALAMIDMAMAELGASHALILRAMGRS